MREMIDEERIEFNQYKCRRAAEPLRMFTPPVLDTPEERVQWRKKIEHARAIGIQRTEARLRLKVSDRFDRVWDFACRYAERGNMAAAKLVLDSYRW
jgi:hypothetical protein